MTDQMRYKVIMWKNGKKIRTCSFGAYNMRLAEWYGNLFAWGTQPEPDRWEVTPDEAS